MTCAPCSRERAARGGEGGEGGRMRPVDTVPRPQRPPPWSTPRRAPGCPHPVQDWRQTTDRTVYSPILSSWSGVVPPLRYPACVSTFQYPVCVGTGPVTVSCVASASATHCIHASTRIHGCPLAPCTHHPKIRFHTPRRRGSARPSPVVALPAPIRCQTRRRLAMESCPQPAPLPEAHPPREGCPKSAPLP